MNILTVIIFLIVGCIAGYIIGFLIVALKETDNDDDREGKNS